MNMSNHTCSDRPLPTCKTSIVVTATIFTVFKADTHIYTYIKTESELCALETLDNAMFT